jgi:hypothetical protein
MVRLLKSFLQQRGNVVGWDVNDCSNEAWAGFFENNPDAGPAEVVLELGVIAKLLYDTFRFTKCSCEETEEFALYIAEAHEWAISQAAGPVEKVEAYLEYVCSNPFEGKEIEVECDRCRALRSYEQFIGDG